MITALLAPWWKLLPVRRTREANRKGVGDLENFGIAFCAGNA
jgi:hypothetical protein